jgi:hemerythrin-like domain-containing protein
MSPDTHDMIVVHRVFRRESRLLPDLVAAVRPGDVARARTLAGHVRDYRLGLHEHHTGEDELVWPLLLARIDLDADLVLRMEVQHKAVASTLDAAIELLRKWEATADGPTRDELAAALRQHRVQLLEHLDEEERSILPLIAEHLTVAEWQALNDRFQRETPKDKLLFFLGAILEEATPAERAKMLGNLPLFARVLWRTVGRPRYARRVHRVRASA